MSIWTLLSGTYDATMSRTGSNRGPAAAASNRQALLRAARDLFAERGYTVPLSVIAKHAGVGQGVLYRHFPTRQHLAVAVFEENFSELETLASEPSPRAFDRFFDRLVELTLESLGFVEVVVRDRDALGGYEGHERLRGLAEQALVPARDAGIIRQDLDADDVALGLQMIYGVAITASDVAHRRASVQTVQSLLSALWRASPDTRLE